jgi:mRNA interferase MazF
LKRGAIWTAAAAGSYAGKPRPIVIVQDNRFDKTASVTVVPLTTDPVEAPLFRLRIEPTPANGLRAVSRLMADKVTTVPKAKLRDRIGRLDQADLRRLDAALLIFLGLAGGPSATRSHGSD